MVADAVDACACGVGAYLALLWVCNIAYATFVVECLGWVRCMVGNLCGAQAALQCGTQST